MSRPLFVLGLGGFGKWVVTAFKSQILDIYGQKPHNIDWLAFDIVGKEIPSPQYNRFELGKLKQECLDFSDNSKEFLSISGNIANEIQSIKTGEEDCRFVERISKKEVEVTLSALEQGASCAERRHASMFHFVSNIENIKRTLSDKLHNNSIIFVVSSWAGGTGAGIFLDCMFLLRNLMLEYGGTLISITLLPQGFEKVKINEDMGPLYGNCYATFREFLRFYSPYGNTKVHYSQNDISLQDISKPIGVDVLSDVAFMVDGSNIGDQKDSNVPYIRGTVPSIATFITNSFLVLPYEQQEIKAIIKNLTSFDQGKTHATANFTNTKAKDKPYNSLAFASFGSYRLIFDSKAIKTEFAQKIATVIFGHKHFQAPSWIPDIEFYVKDYMTNISECTKFDKEIIHECITKGHQISNFATYRNLKNRLEEEVKFPEFDIDIAKLKNKSNLQNTNKLVSDKFDSIKGNATDNYIAKDNPTFFAVRNYYYDYYTKNFAWCIQKKTLEILNNGKGEDSYGKGNLKAAENFVKSMKTWYARFIRGLPETNEKTAFHVVCDITDQVEGTYANWQGKVDQYYKDNQKKGKTLLSDPSKEYLKMKYKLNELELRDLKRELVRDIAEENLAYLENLEQMIDNWLKTIKACHATLEEGLDNIIEGRNIKKSIVSDEYLTVSEDEIETKLYSLVTNYDDWEKINYAKTDYNNIDTRFKEIINKVPHRKWASFLSGFNWTFNNPDENCNLSSEINSSNALFCLVDSGMPGFPIHSAEENKEKSQNWSYKLVEYFINHQDLNKLDNISAFEVLMLHQANPGDTLSRLQERSALMLSYDETKEGELRNKGYCNHPPANHFSIIADFGYTGNQTELKAFIDTFSNNMNNPNHKGSIAVADERNKPSEIVFLSSRFCLPAPAMRNLYETKSEYLRRMDSNIPPPLHLFKGEKEAYKYETQIAEYFQTDHEELHPQVVSNLEKEVIVQGENMPFIQCFLWSNILGIIKKEDNPLSGMKSYFLDLEDKEILGESPEWPLYSDVIYNLIYSKTKDLITSNRIVIEELTKKVESALNETTESKKEQLINDQAEEYKKIIKQKGLPKREKDLYKVWVTVLNNNIAH